MAAHNAWIAKDFKARCPFESFYPQYGQATAQCIINNIDEAIIDLLENAIHHTNMMPLDVAFIRINCLVQYVTSYINHTFPDLSDDLCTGYYKFLFHFLIHGCCLGNQYTKHIALDPNDKHYQRNKVLRHCMDHIVPHINRSNIQYKYNHSHQNTIIHCVSRYLYHNVQTVTNNIEYNVSQLVADFTAYHFEEFFCAIIEFCHDWMELLMSPQFVSLQDDDLNYFANQTLFIQSVDLSPVLFRPKMIRTVYQNMTIKPWMDALAFVEFFETLDRRYNPSHDSQYIAHLFEKCIDNTQCDVLPPALSVFFNGNNEQIVNYAMDTRSIQRIYDNIDFFFTAFVDEYCIQRKRVLIHLFRQIINCLVYFYSNKFITKQCVGLKSKIIDKLYDYMMVKLVKNIGYDEFMEMAKTDSWQILDALHKTDRYQIKADALKGHARGAVSWIIGLQAIPVLFKRLLSNPQVFGQLLRRYHHRTRFSHQALQLTASFIDQLQETNLFHHLQSNPEILIDLIHRCQSRLQQEVNV
eukprot:251009_1